jgi:sulfotransferase family protein
MRPIFIGGCERSGTTMLGAMLGSHSECICVPESQFIEDLIAWSNSLRGSLNPRQALSRIVTNHRYRLLWELPLDPAAADPSELGSSLPELLTWLARAYGRKSGKAGSLWVDHTPTNFRRGRTLLGMFPEARFIHLIRDGRAVAASLLPLDWGPNNVLHAAEFWMARCALGLAAELEWGPGRVLRVRYEDLLNQPEPSMRRIASFSGLEYEPAMVSGGGHRPGRYHARQHHLVGLAPDPSRVERWQQIFTRRQVEIFEAEAGEFLETLGYRPRYGISALPASRVEVLRLRVGDIARRASNNLRRRWRARKSISRPQSP